MQNQGRTRRSRRQSVHQDIRQIDIRRCGVVFITITSQRRKALWKKTLDQFAVGEHGIVKNVVGEGKIKRRLFDMGINPRGGNFTTQKSPFGRSVGSDDTRIRTHTAQDGSVLRKYGDA